MRLGPCGDPAEVPVVTLWVLVSGALAVDEDGPRIGDEVFAAVVGGKAFLPVGGFWLVCAGVHVSSMRCCPLASSCSRSCWSRAV